ncbi:unnamed protein product [Cuscuta campestris]|uniref:Uncharacterized protein n=1 Tax=Cuscuta campestris TaxID=132261 RepID=A0A484MJU7_9ASTE|nr:unnamed protein product [Cuscuta campestris]
MGVTAEQLQAAVAALSSMGRSGLGTRTTHTPRGPNTEHAATSQHKGKKTQRSRRRPGKAPMIEEVLVEDISEGEVEPKETKMNLDFYVLMESFLVLKIPFSLLERAASKLESELEDFATRNKVWRRSRSGCMSVYRQRMRNPAR